LKIDEFSEPFRHQIGLLSTIPGVTTVSATRIISEIGVDMAIFHSGKHLCSWAGLVPQNNESAGKKKSVKISRAGVYLKPLLVQCANAAIKSNQNPYFKIKYQNIKKRLGHKKAIIAIARMILTCAYHMILNNQIFEPSDFNITSQTTKPNKTASVDQQLQSAIALLQANGFSITNTDSISVQ